MTRVLDKLARNVIDARLDSMGEVTLDEVVDLILPFIDISPDVLLTQKAKQIARGLMRARRDSTGTRTCFATKRANVGTVYIDIDSCQNTAEVRIVERQLYEKRKGLVKSHRKAQTNLRVLEGQMMMADMEGVK